jgi:hexosaminidase
MQSFLVSFFLIQLFITNLIVHGWSIWPQPKSIINGSTLINIDLDWTIEYTESSDLLSAIERYENLFFSHTTSTTPTENVITKLIIEVIDVNADLQLYVDESYTLNITLPQIIIQSETVFGAYHGLETLSQLIQFDFDTKLYYISDAPFYIEDEPRFPHRGLLIDTSRHFLPIQTIKNIIDSITYTKLNTLHWHLVDSQSFPFDSSSYPKLSQLGSYSKFERYSTEDVQEIVQYAKSRGVRIMVEIDTPGHAVSWCNGYPDVCPSLDCTSPLNVANNFTFTVIEGLFNDLTGGIKFGGLFPETMMHLGGDEVDTSCWTKTQSISDWMAENDMTPSDAYGYFIQRVQSIAHSMEREVVGWEEIWDTIGTELDPSTIIHQWLPGSTIAPAVTAAGYRLLWSTDGIWYLDGLTVSWETMYTAEPCEGIPDDETSLVLGGEGCMWGETADTSDVQQTKWPRMAARGERGW